MKNKQGFVPVLILLALSILGLVVYFGYPYLKPKEVAVAPTPKVSSETVADTSQKSIATADPTVGWKDYTSPEIGSYVSPFQIKYPPTWILDQEVKMEDPKSLIVTLTNSKNEIIKISQGAGGGGACIFYDDSNYASFEGMGQFFSSYSQLNKPTFWRISQYRDKINTSHVICEKSKDRYVDTTRIGWISVDVNSNESIKEVSLILEEIIFKPTINTKTLFD